MERLQTSETDSSGRHRSAEEIRLLNDRQKRLESTLEDAPSDTMARIQLASLLLARKQMQAGARQLVEAVATLDGNAEVILQLASLLQLCGETKAARKCLDHPALLQTASANVMALHANQRYMIGEVPFALELLNKAMAAGADGPAEHQLLATLQQFCGQMDQAAETFEYCLKRWPRFGSAALARSRLRKQDAENNHIDYLRARLKEIPSDQNNKDAMQVRAEFEFALFKELDDLGSYEDAWSALQRGNALLSKIKLYDAQGEEKLVDALIAASARVPAEPPRHPPGNATPIFVVGLPRSGTTLLDRMLSSHSKVVSAGELKGFKRHMLWGADATPGSREEMFRCLEAAGEIDYGAVRRRYLEQTEWSTNGKPFFIDKQPLNFQLVPFIRQAFPESPILHIVRDPVSVCFSNYKILYGQVTAYNNDLESLVHYYKLYARLIRHWKGLLPEAMLEIDYARLVQHPQDVMQEVLSHCGLDLEQNCIRPELNTAPVATPSSTQVREPIHTRSMEEWTNYESHLGILVSQLPH